MPIQKPTPEQQADIDAHWAQVRSGEYRADAHVWRDDLSAMIDTQRFLARKCIEGAAAHMRHAAQLAEVQS